MLKINARAYAFALILKNNYMCNCEHACGNCEKLSAEDEAIKKQYEEMNGIGSLDIGSRKMLLKQVLKMAKAKGYKVSAFYDCKEFPMERLRAVFHTLQSM